MEPESTMAPLRATVSLAQKDEAEPAGNNKRDLKSDGATASKETGEDDDPTEDYVYITGFKLAAVIVGITLSTFVLLLDISIISTAIPRITSEFHSLPDVGWYGAAYQLSSASLQPLTGKIYTHFSAKWTFLCFFIVFELGSLVCALSHSSSVFIGGRTIAGLGASGMMNGGLTVISGAVPLEKRPLYTGIMLGIGQLGVVSGPLIGGALTEYTTWRWCFYINLPVGALSGLLLVLTHVPELTVKPPLSLSLIRKTIPELDLIGFIFFAPASVMLLMALQFGGNSYAWNSSIIIGLFCGAVVTAIIFIFWERRRGDRAMLSGSIVKQRVVYSSTLQGMFLMSTIYAASSYLPIYFQAVKGEGPSISGVDLLPGILTQLFFAVFTGFLVSKLGYYLPFPILGGVLTAMGSGLMSTISPLTETAKWAGYQIILGAGRGMGMQMNVIAIQNTVSANHIPVALAFLIFAQNFAGSVFVVLATVIFTQSLRSEVATHAPSVSPEAALSAGGSASAVRSLLPAGSPELEGLLLAFSNSVDRVFYLLAGCGVLSFVASWGMGWKDIRKKKKPEKGSI